MKKSAFMLIALALLVALGAGAASAASVASGQTATTTMPAGIEIKQFIELKVGDVMPRYNYTSVSYDGGTPFVVLSGPGNPNTNAIGWPITVRSNAGVVMTAVENVSSVLAGVPYNYPVWAFDTSSGQSYWLIAPNVEIFKDNWSNHFGGNASGTVSNTGRFASVPFPVSGKHQAIVQFNAQYRLDAPGLPGGTLPPDFTILQPGKYVGTVTITVEPKP